MSVLMHSVVRILTVFLVFLYGCTVTDTVHPTTETGPNAYTFPAGFLFGAATAGFQVDMGCPTLSPDVCDDTRSDWYGFATSDELIDRWYTFLSGDNPSKVGPGHWELYETDFDLAAYDCRHNAFRMSIEWSRIFPTSTVGIEGYENLRLVADEEALQHYHRVFAALRERGLEPFVTLNHYTLPDWIHDGIGCSTSLEACSRRGWLDRETTVHEIAKYAGFVAREFGGSVDLWGTLNEPYAVLLSGYLLPTPMRTNPPVAILNGEAFKMAYSAMIDAHARMYDAVKEQDTQDANGDGSSSMIGVVHAVAPVSPKDRANEMDQRAAENVFYLWNTAFLDAVALGEYDERLDGHTVFRDDLAGRMDFLGVNYKVRISVEGLPFPLLPRLSPLTTFNPLTLDMDEVFPRGIRDMAVFFYERYGLPILITENNGQHVPKGDMATEVRYLVENLSWLSLAIKEGVDIRGYFYWALMDNFEWNHGMNVQLGLYQVNPEDSSKERIPRETVQVYAAIAEAGGVPSYLSDLYPVNPNAAPSPTP